MNAITRATLVAGFLLAPVTADASLTVTPGLTVVNTCPSDVIIAVHYKTSRGDWTTTSFVSIPARKRKNAVVSSPNRIFYIYAKTLSGKYRWSGKHKFKVDGKFYPMQKMTLSRNRDKNRYLIRLRCR